MSNFIFDWKRLKVRALKANPGSVFGRRMKDKKRDREGGGKKKRKEWVEDEHKSERD